MVALFLTGGNKTEAIKAAGYKCTTPKSWNNMACKLFADARVKAAVLEECANRLATDAPRNEYRQSDRGRSIRDNWR